MVHGHEVYRVEYEPSPLCRDLIPAVKRKHGEHYDSASVNLMVGITAGRKFSVASIEYAFQSLEAIQKP